MGPGSKLDFSGLFLYTSPMARGFFTLFSRLIVIFVFFISCRVGTPADPLTVEEREWLSSHSGKIRLGTESNLNLYSSNEGVYNGIAADYIKLLQEKLDITFRIVRIETWEEEMKKISNREVDVANNLTGTSRLSEYMLFTRSYLEFPALFIVRKHLSIPLTRQFVSQHKIVITKNDSLEQFLYNKYPGVTIEVVPDPISGLRMVSEGNAEMIVMNDVTANYYFQETGITNLKIANPTGYIYKSSIASRNDWPILNRILDKGLQMITESEHQAILGRWINKKYFWQNRKFWMAFLVITAAAFFLILLILTWNYTLRKKVKEQTGKIQTELTEKIKVQKDLEKSENRYKLLSSATFEGIVLTEEGKILDLNHQLTEIYGYEREEILGSSFFDLVVPGDRDLLKSHILSGDERPCELRAIHKDRSHLYLEMRGRSITIDNRAMRIIAISNITARKKAEKDARKQQELLIQADKMISLGILVSGMAHEINNPNNSIMLNTEVLKESWDSIFPILEEYQGENPDFLINGIMYEEMKLKIPLLFEAVLRNAHRIQKIVIDLKNFSKKEVAPPTYNGIGSGKNHGEEKVCPKNKVADGINKQDPLGFKGPIAVNNAVESAVSLLNTMIKKSTNHFLVELEENLPEVMGNFQNIEQVLINLIQNACQALPNPGKSIRIYTRSSKKDNMIEIAVQDEGTGIEKKHLKLITDPFFTTKRGLGGTGLGLFISSKIIHHHGGTLTFDSTPGKGTTALIRIPGIPKKVKR